MLPAARLTDKISSTSTSGVPVPVVATIANVLIGSLPALRMGDSCGSDAILKGSLTVLIGGIPAARVGDPSAGGGAVLPPGLPTVLIGG